MTRILGKKGHDLGVTRLYGGESLPDFKALNWLIILGGEMGVHDEKIHPWLRQEKAFILKALESGIPVLGICLGAQLMAHVMGARVGKNPCPEIGWFPVTLSDRISGTILGHALPETFEAFHWHDDTFEIPKGALPIGSSPACPNQGFILGDRIVGLQFHPEVRYEDAAAFFAAVGPGPEHAPYVQTRKEIFSMPRRFDANARLMASVVEAMEKAAAP